MLFENFNESKKIKFKTGLKLRCMEVLAERIKNSHTAINEAQDSANNEQKSSSGDKYETARAMAQLNIEMNTKQLNETKQQLSFLQIINVEITYNKIGVGSVAVCEDKLFFISIGLGNLKWENNNIICLSAKSPLYNELKQKSAGCQFKFQDKIYRIENVF